MKKILLTGLILGMLSIVFGAFGAHGLKGILSEAGIESFKTAVDYQMYHALFLIGLYLLSKMFSTSLMNVIFYLTTFGVICFSGSIYFLVLNSAINWMELPKLIALITPLGGLLLMSAWLILIIKVIKHK